MGTYQSFGKIRIKPDAIEAVDFAGASLHVYLSSGTKLTLKGAAAKEFQQWFYDTHEGQPKQLEVRVMGGNKSSWKPSPTQ